MNANSMTLCVVLIAIIYLHVIKWRKSRPPNDKESVKLLADPLSFMC